jgi:hypothetical protein
MNSKTSTLIRRASESMSLDKSAQKRAYKASKKQYNKTPRTKRKMIKSFLCQTIADAKLRVAEENAKKSDGLVN